MCGSCVSNMDPDILRSILVSFQIVVLIFVIIGTLHAIHGKNTSVVAVFFIYGMICFLFSDFYWFVHSLLRPDSRIPFSVNEIGEMGLFLLFTSMLHTIFKDTFKKPRLETLLAVIFSISVAALWIGWTGEWVKDIISGIAFGTFVCATIRSVRACAALTKTESVVTGIAAYVLIIMQGAIFFVNENLGRILDICCYILMYTVMAWLFAKAVRTLVVAYGKQDPGSGSKVVSTSLLCMAWVINTMYMSSEPIYFVATFICTLTLPVLMYSVLHFLGIKDKKEDDAV